MILVALARTNILRLQFDELRSRCWSSQWFLSGWAHLSYSLALAHFALPAFPLFFLAISRFRSPSLLLSKTISIFSRQAYSSDTDGNILQPGGCPEPSPGICFRIAWSCDPCRRRVQRHTFHACTSDHDSPGELHLPEDFLAKGDPLRRRRPDCDLQERVAYCDAFHARHLRESRLPARESSSPRRDCILYHRAYSNGSSSEIVSERAENKAHRLATRWYPNSTLARRFRDLGTLRVPENTRSGKERPLSRRKSRKCLRSIRCIAGNHMKFHETKISGVFEIHIEPNSDDRGFFARAWCWNEFEDHGLNPKLVQCNTSYQHAKGGTLRGMHYQVAPFP